MTNQNVLLLLACAAVITLVYLAYRNCSENFWGGWMPVPYLGQPIQRYGRSGMDAATDAAPRMIVDPSACPINPRYCPHCKGYRCCCT